MNWDKIVLGFAACLALPLLPLFIEVKTEPIAYSAQGTPQIIWSTPVNVSTTTSYSWFPDIAVDNLGNVHLVWCESVPQEIGGHKEYIYYTKWDGETWTRPNDIVGISADINRNAIAADTAGNLHLLFGGSTINPLSIYYKRAPIEAAWSAASWSDPQPISASGSYMSDIAIDSHGVIHVIYDHAVESAEAQPGSSPEICVGCADIFYQRSTDGGRTWSYPSSLSDSPTGSSRPQLEIDGADHIHVVWDEGWDRLTGQGEPISSVYTVSLDGGNSWSEPVTFSYPEGTNAQLTVGVDGWGNTLVVWRATSRDEIFYTLSSDKGASWSAPAVIPKILARRWSSPFDMFDMTTDSGGHVHLLMVGRISTEQERPGVYHLVWDGAGWSPPVQVYADAGFPLYPKILVSQGNRLHAVWSELSDELHVDYGEIWYSSSMAASPPQTPIPLSTLTRSPTPTPEPSPTPTITPYPTIPPGASGLPTGLYTENDDLLRMALALSPMLLIVAIFAALRRGRLR